MFRYEIADTEGKEQGLSLLMATSAPPNHHSLYGSHMHGMDSMDQSVLPLIPKFQHLSVMQHTEHYTTAAGPEQEAERKSGPLDEAEEQADGMHWDDSMEMEDTRVDRDKVDYQNHQDYDPDQDDVDYQSSSAAESEDSRQGGGTRVCSGAPHSRTDR